MILPLEDLPAWLEIIIRAFVIYIVIIAGIRIFGKKELSQLSVIDFVFILLISNAVQNAMVGPDASLEGGLIAAGTLFVTNYILKKITLRSKRIKAFIEGKELLLIYKGKINEENLHKAEITKDELMAVIREHGLHAVEEVGLAILEVSGSISVLTDNFEPQKKK